MARCRTGLDFADRSAGGTRRAWTLPTSYGCAAGGEVGALDFTGRTPPPVPAWTLPTQLLPSAPLGLYRPCRGSRCRLDFTGRVEAAARSAEYEIAGRNRDRRWRPGRRRRSRGEHAKLWGRLPVLPGFATSFGCYIGLGGGPPRPANRRLIRPGNEPPRCRMLSVEPDKGRTPHPGKAAAPSQPGREAEECELVAEAQHRPSVYPGRRPDLGQVHHTLHYRSNHHEHNKNRLWWCPGAAVGTLPGLTGKGAPEHEPL
jgi:hypothetical protein